MGKNCMLIFNISPPPTRTALPGPLFQEAHNKPSGQRPAEGCGEFNEGQLRAGHTQLVQGG